MLLANVAVPRRASLQGPLPRVSSSALLLNRVCAPRFVFAYRLEPKAAEQLADQPSLLQSFAGLSSRDTLYARSH